MKKIMAAVLAASASPPRMRRQVRRPSFPPSRPRLPVAPARLSSLRTCSSSQAPSLHPPRQQSSCLFLAQPFVIRERIYLAMVAGKPTVKQFRFGSLDNLAVLYFHSTPPCFLQSASSSSKRRQNASYPSSPLVSHSTRSAYIAA